MRGSPVLLSAFSVKFNSLNVKSPGWVYLFCIIFVGYYLYQILIITEHFICTFFLLSFLTYADVYVAINLHLANS